MYTDARISAALESMVHAVDAPPVPLADIQRKIALPQPVVRHTSRYFRLAIATMGIIAVIFVAWRSDSLSFIRVIEDRYRAALQARGGFAPPPPPEALWRAVQKQAWALPDATLATAQSRVPFTIVPPTGLPRNVVSARIRTAPTGVYSTVTHSWQIGPSVVTFIYRRAGGRSFDLLADEFDPKSSPPGKYIFEAKDSTADGRPVLVKHEIFYWRNGDQVMSAIEGEGISGREIEAIRIAMHGIALPGRWPYRPEPGDSLKFYTITEQPK
jgi:hypothetical protein